MSLFPAYAQNSGESNGEATAVSVQETQEEATNSNMSAALEAKLLESDNDEDIETITKPAAPTSCTTDDNNDFYLDPAFDCGNLGVSTLYYPGRPKYETRRRNTVGSEKSRKRPRYFEAPPEDAPGTHDEISERIQAFRRMLADNRTDEALWLRFIDFQERYRDAEAALAVAQEAEAQLGDSSAKVRAELHRLCSRVLQPHQYLDVLRTQIKKNAQNAALSTELWLRLLDAVAARGNGGELDAAVVAALPATRSVPTAYPHILYIYGGYLRSAGLWERLVLLLELVTSMNFGQEVFPPAQDPARIETSEQCLIRNEDEMINSGLPLSTVWSRVERYRAGAHWRAGNTDDVDSDPQRVPLAADIAQLLLPVQAPAAQHLLLVNALRLAKVPLLPCSGYALRSVEASNNAAGDYWWASCGESLLALVRASRRLSQAHPAHADNFEASRTLALAVDPPHYFNDSYGFQRWVQSLWDACCQWTTGAARIALVCWRLKWLHALVLLGDFDMTNSTGTEKRKIRAEAKAILKDWAGNSPIVFAQFVRIEQVFGGPERARRAGLKTLRAALQDSDAPPVQRLYVARVATEVCDELESRSGTWATACAVLGVPLPANDLLEDGPPKDMIDEALRMCEEKCTEIEAALNTDEDIDGNEAGPLVAMLPSDAEWAAARARLASASRRAELLQRVSSAATAPLGRTAQRYWEQSACALVVASAREHRMAVTARALAPLFPHNALLALVCSDGPLWACDAGAEREQLIRAAQLNSRTHVGALATVLAPLLNAYADEWTPAAAAKLVSACVRAGRGGAGGALLGVVRLEAEAHSPRARPQSALLAALADHPHHKWLYVRGASWCPAEAEYLADVLLERGLRIHALRDELIPPISVLFLVPS